MVIIHRTRSRSKHCSGKSCRFLKACHFLKAQGLKLPPKNNVPTLVPTSEQFKKRGRDAVKYFSSMRMPKLRSLAGEVFLSAVSTRIKYPDTKLY